jgi:hypothetical protein
VLPPEVVTGHLGRLTRGKLTGLELILDSIKADASLTSMTDMNSAFAGGKPAKKYAEHLQQRARYPDQARATEDGAPLPSRGPRYATPEEIAIFAGQVQSAEEVIVRGPRPVA